MAKLTKPNQTNLSCFLFCFNFPYIYIYIGYVKQYRQLKSFLSQQDFANQIEVIGKEDYGITGNFEIMIGSGDKASDLRLIHSKRRAGQGKAESSRERAMICEFIQEYLEQEME